MDWVWCWHMNWIWTVNWNFDGNWNVLDHFNGVGLWYGDLNWDTNVFNDFYWVWGLK